MGSNNVVVVVDGDVEGFAKVTLIPYGDVDADLPAWIDRLGAVGVYYVGSHKEE